MTVELPPSDDGPALLGRLGRRYLLLSAAGLAGLPHRPPCTFIIISTRQDWTDACMAQVEDLIRSSDQMLVVPSAPGLVMSPYNIEYRIGVDGLNLALFQSTGEFIILVQDRIRLSPQWLDRLLWPFLDDERIAMTAPCSMLERHHGKRTPWIDSEAELHAYALEQHEGFNGVLLETGLVSGCCAVIRRSRLEHVGGVDDRIQHAELQFADWCLRIRRQGYSINYCADVYVHALFTWPAQEEIVGSQRVWDYFGRKWNVADHLKPGQEAWGQIDSIDPYRLAAQSVLLLEQVTEQPLVTCLITIRSAMEVDADTAWFEAFALQSYPHTEWIVLRVGLPESGGGDTDTYSMLGSYSSIVASITVRDEKISMVVDHAARMLARGRYVIPLDMEEEYPSCYVANWVHQRFMEGG